MPRHVTADPTALRAAGAGAAVLAGLLLTLDLADPTGLLAPGRAEAVLTVTAFFGAAYLLRRGFLTTWGALVLAALTGRFLGTVPLGEGPFTTAWASGFTGVYLGVLCWPAAIPAWIVTRRTRRAWGRAVPEFTLMAAFAGVGGLLVLGNGWWTHSPVGYVFGGGWWFFAPTASAGVVGGLAGLGVFLAVVHVASARLGAGPGRFLGCWLACVCGGLFLGFAQSVAALLSYGPADAPSGDLWPVFSLFIRLAVGASYGAVIGLFAATATILLPGRKKAAVPVLALAMTLSPEAAALPDRAITDGQGRQVLLRGVGVNQLVDYWSGDSTKQTVRPLTDDDFRQMAAMGFSAVRLAVSWSLLEPTPGTLDAGYVARIRRAVDQAAANDMVTVIDLHQDAWGRGVVAPMGATCPTGTTPMIGWDGAPGWATPFDGSGRCQFLAKELAPVVNRAFSNFYADRDGVQTRLVATWGRLAREFAGSTAVAGFDLMNSPGLGETPPLTSSAALGRFYARAVAAIREAERAAGGHRHLIFFEPGPLWAPWPGFADDPGLVLAVKPGDLPIDPARAVALSARMAERYGTPLWTSAWGGGRLAAYAKAEDSAMIGGAFWVWKQACGDPHLAGTDPATAGNLVTVDCATGTERGPSRSVSNVVSRAYPRAVPGRLSSVWSDPERRHLRLTGTKGTGRCDLDVWAPGATRPAVTTSGISSVAFRRVPGGWRLSGCPAGDFVLELR
ncbi:cellulase family glycosylhydrolase [Herbidospora sp. NEAU-GS84]|uniref:Cellulase family glycosylhydrolase n=1 Tax=Herbidospora solisilvae TaxID=2696284 RepID=A0A7C9NSH4_9ACTN|nr:cellulase family glycosylhydrolase [Herbidospora solisilvae]NAS26516.1 cellulase family glycosylhydrolase [Herbidospora solisilvae]